MNVRILALALGFVLSSAGCAAFDHEKFEASGAQASAFCTRGGPSPLVGGIVAGGKVNEGFKGTVAINKDCEILIQEQ